MSVQQFGKVNPVRHRRRVLRFTALPVAASLTLSGCSLLDRSDDKETGQGGGQASPSSQRTVQTNGVFAREGIYGGRSIVNTQPGKFRTEILGVERQGDFTRMRVALTLRGWKEQDSTHTGDMFGDYQFSAFWLVDPVGRKAYATMNSPHMSPVESWFNKGARYEVTVWFPELPANVKTVTVVTPGSPGELTGVPVVDGKARPPAGATPAPPTIEPTRKPEAGETVVWDSDPPGPDARPRVSDLTDFAENAERTSQSKAGEQTEQLRSDVLFAFDSDKLSGKAQQVLDKVAGELSQRADPGKPVTVEGHTDGKGDDSYNQPLSERRAKAVQNAIAPKLGGATQFQISGKGASEPVAKEGGADDTKARARNRRVVITYALKAGVQPGVAPGGAAGSSAPAKPAQFRPDDGRVVAERTAKQNNSTGDPIDFRLRVHPFYRDGAFLVAVLELTNLTADLEAVTFEDGAQLGNRTGAFSATEAGGTTYRTVRWGEESYFSSDPMYYGPQEPYRTYLYLSAPPAATKSLTLNAGPFGQIQNVPIDE